MKILKLLSILIFSIFLISTVSALIVVDAQWEDGSQSINITEGKSASFDVYFTTDDYPMDVEVKLYNSDNK